MKIPIFYQIEQYFKNKRRSKPNAIGNNNNINVSKNDWNRVRIVVEGSDNNITIKPLGSSGDGQIIIWIYGDNCNIQIDEGCICATNLFLDLGNKVFGKSKNINVQIGANTRFESAKITTSNSNTNIIVGENCLFANEVNLFNTDGHPIYDATSEKLINHSKDLIIGNHCWLGYKATILKNVHLADNCIVGWGAVVAKSFDEPNVAIAGNPAKIVKRNVNWKFTDNGEFVENNWRDEEG